MWSKSFRESLKRQLIQKVCGQSELDKRPIENELRHLLAYYPMDAPGDS